MWDHAKDWAQIAPIVTLVVALFALVLAWRQLALNRANQRETTAKTTFRDYLKLAVEHPELSAGNYEVVAKDDKLLEQYEWFVGYFLWAAEELFEFAPQEDVWGRNLQMLANYHCAYFKNSTDFMTREFGTYSAKTRALIDRAIASGTA
jgi:nitrate reductase gamma subunit